MKKTTDGIKMSAKDRTPEYRAWKSIKQRCYNQNTKDYIFYGARGIRVCERWLNSYEDFLEDMGMRPEAHSIDRIDHNGHYEPSNCRWATQTQQQNNRRSNRFITHDGRTMTIAEWARELGINYFTLQSRITKKHKPIAIALQK